MTANATMEAPAAPATGATPDLIVHDWGTDPELIPEGNDLGDCLNPEKVSVDFGDKGKGRSLTFLLGVRANGTWRVGWHAVTKSDEHTERCLGVGKQYPTRHDALHDALRLTTSLFFKDKHCARCVEAFYEKIGEKPTVMAQVFAREEPDPLPKPRFLELPVAAIVPNPENHRKHFDEIALSQLAASIKQHGLLQPIAVRKLGADELGELPGVGGADRYEIILGERRWRAHVAAKLEVIDAKVYEGVTRKQAKAAALVENLQRQDINPIEEAEGYRDLMEAENLTQDRVADRVGRSRPAVANALRLLNLPEKTLAYIRAGELTPAHGVALARFRPKNEEHIPNWRQIVDVIAEEAVLGNLTAGALEKGLPCEGALVRSGLVARCDAYSVGGEWPEETLNHPAYIGENWYRFCLNPPHWQAFVTAHKKAQEEAAEAERKKAEAAAKKPSKIKSLHDLPSRAYRQIDKEDQALMSELLPEDKVKEVDGYQEGEKVSVCLAPKFATLVSNALDKHQKADREAKLPELFEAAREKIRRIRKLGPAEMALFLGAVTGNEEDVPRFAKVSLKAQGVKLPKALEPEGWRRVFSAKWLQAAASDHVALVRVLLDAWLLGWFSAEGYFDDDAEEVELSFTQADEQGLVILRALLDRDNLGLLDETKAGRKKLVQLVKAEPWYADAFAQAEKDGDATEIEDNSESDNDSDADEEGEDDED